MRTLRIQPTLAAAAVAALLLAASPAAAQCDNGREGTFAQVEHGLTNLQWRIEAVYEKVTLTVAAPCGLVVERTFGKGEDPFFDLREIPADPDGRYHWQVRIHPPVDPEVAKALAKAHAEGQDGRDLEYELRQKGMLPQGPFTQSGAFTVLRGAIVPPDGKEDGGAQLKASVGSGGTVLPASTANCPFDGAATMGAVRPARLPEILPAVDRGGSTRAVAAASEAPRRIAAADQVIPDDLIVQGSECVGFDCVNNEVFSFDTIRLKENNLRIHFDDTSTIAGFPANDWRLIANDSASGGASKFSIEDSTGARTPFTIRAGASTNSIFVDSTGRVGFRTSTPVLDLHVNTSNTPAIRLEQNNSGGFTAQTWDIGANEANFFIRDVTGGSRLSFRIRPGAPTSSIDISADGDVGIGTASPDDKLHVLSSADPANGQLFIENTNATAAQRTLINMQNNGGVRWQVNDRFQVRFNNNQFQFDNTTNPGNECVIDELGNLTCLGAKNFATLDPTDASRAIYYAALEGPEAGTYHRGSARLIDGEAVIELPGHFSKVTEAEGMTVQVTPIGGWAQLYVVEKTPEKLVVRVADRQGDVDQFDYIVHGVRRGYLDYQVERSSANLIGDSGAN